MSKASTESTTQSVAGNPQTQLNMASKFLARITMAKNAPQQEALKKLLHVERNYNARVEMEEQEYDREKKRLERQKVDIFRWMRVPVDPHDKQQLAKMVRVRLLELLSDVSPDF